MDVLGSFNKKPAYIEEARLNEIKLKEGNDSSKALLVESFDPRFDYNGLMNKYREEFEKRWNEMKPSAQVDVFPFEDHSIIGVGKFGTVRLMKSRHSAQYYAVKVLRKEAIVKEQVVEKTITEKNFLGSVNFPFVISLVFSSKDNDCLYLGLPFIGGGDLFNLHRRRTRFSETIARFYAAQILLALEYLHNVKCVYRDLKLENILIDVTGYLKLTDFGLSKLVESRTTTLCGTPEYLAPEMLRMKPYGTSVDWWTFGVLLFELVAGYTPFVKYSENLVTMYTKICEGCFEIPNGFSPELRNLVRGLLDTHMATRLGSLCNGCSDIKNHPFFRELSWRSILNQTAMPPFRPRLSHPADVSYFRKFSASKLKLSSEKSKRNLYPSLFERF